MSPLCESYLSAEDLDAPEVSYPRLVTEVAGNDGYLLQHFAAGIPVPGVELTGNVARAAVAQTKPDCIFVLPWNLRDEINEQLSYVKSWGEHLVFQIPALEVS